MNHGWSAFFPVWARDGGPERFAVLLKDTATRDRIKQDKDFKTWVHEHGGWEGIVMGRAGSPANRKYEGMRLSEIAKLRGDADQPIPASRSWPKTAAASLACSTPCRKTMCGW